MFLAHLPGDPAIPGVAYDLAKLAARRVESSVHRAESWTRPPKFTAFDVASDDLPSLSMVNLMITLCNAAT